ncbi:MAG: hypothetical protein WKF75_06685, partial [Singulisphaera sp.]
MDEFPGRFRPLFGQIDANHDGYIDAAELKRSLDGASANRPTRGKVVARTLYTVADDFVVDIYLNGERVPDE